PRASRKDRDRRAAHRDRSTPRSRYRATPPRARDPRTPSSRPPWRWGWRAAASRRPSEARDPVARDRITPREPDRALVAHVLQHALQDRKSTRLNSSHVAISYAVFCLKKKKNK